jgi:hypothetical protein
MSTRGLIPVVPLFVVCIPTAFGQLPKRVEQCLPYPTLAQEIREMRPADPAPPRVRVRVIRVEFDSKDGLPANAQDEISADLRSHLFERDADTAYLNDLANEIAEVGARGALQNHGYFRATAAAKLAVLQTDGSEIGVAAAISPRTDLNTGPETFESSPRMGAFR